MTSAEQVLPVVLAIAFAVIYFAVPKTAAVNLGFLHVNALHLGLGVTAGLAVLLVVASIALIANTIRLSVFARRREVDVMKLVGATNWFIRWPFVIEGMIVGFLGGVLAPGIEISMEALFSRAARLVKVDFAEPPSVIGKTTVAGLQSGLVYGFAGQVDGIVARMRGELGDDARVIATGGLADLVAPHTTSIELVDHDLTLDGLRLVWARNA